MKKRLLTLVLSLCGMQLMAQNPRNYYIQEEQTFRGGLKVGANFTQVDGDSYKGYHKMGLNLGVVAYVKFRPQLYGSIELLFSQKGAKSNGAQASNSGAYAISTQKIGLNYAEIPVQLNFFDKKQNHVGIGLSYAQLISSKEEIKLSNTSYVYDPDKYPFKKSDINFVLSGQLHVVQGLYAGLRFQYSLLSIRDEVNLEFGRAQQFSNVFSISAMYLF